MRKVILKRDTHASGKEAKLVENKNLARDRKKIIAKVSEESDIERR